MSIQLKGEKKEEKKERLQSILADIVNHLYNLTAIDHTVAQALMDRIHKI